MSETRKFTLQDTTELFVAYNALDGRDTIVKGEKGDGVVKVPYEFEKKGKVRYAQAKNLRILKGNVEDYNEAHDKMVKELLKDRPNKTTISRDDDPALFETYMTEKAALLNSEVEVAGLLTIDYDALRVEENGIPGSIVSVLMPLLTEPGST